MATQARDVIARKIRPTHLVGRRLGRHRARGRRQAPAESPATVHGGAGDAEPSAADAVVLHVIGRLRSAPNPRGFMGDAVRIEQALTNLLTNAVKDTPAGSRIQVGLRVDGADAVLSVSDSGFGISAFAAAEHSSGYVCAGRRNHRSRARRPRHRAGPGLSPGRAARGHGWPASSDGEGHGSTFHEQWLRRMPAPDGGSGVSLTQERRAKPGRVLLIEDSAEARERLRTATSSSPDMRSTRRPMPRPASHC